MLKFRCKVELAGHIASYNRRTLVNLGLETITAAPPMYLLLLLKLKMEIYRIESKSLSKIKVGQAASEASEQISGDTHPNFDALH